MVVFSGCSTLLSSWMGKRPKKHCEPISSKRWLVITVFVLSLSIVGKPLRYHHKYSSQWILFFRTAAYTVQDRVQHWVPYWAQYFYSYSASNHNEMDIKRIHSGFTHGQSKRHPVSTSTVLCYLEDRDCTPHFGASMPCYCVAVPPHLSPGQYGRTDKRPMAYRSARGEWWCCLRKYVYPVVQYREALDTKLEPMPKPEIQMSRPAREANVQDLL